MSGEDKSGTAKVRSAGPPRVRTMPGGGSIAGGAHRQEQVTNSVLGRWGGGQVCRWAGVEVGRWADGQVGSLVGMLRAHAQSPIMQAATDMV